MYVRHLQKFYQTWLLVTFATLSNLATSITSTKAADTTSFSIIDALTDVKLKNGENSTLTAHETAREQQKDKREEDKSFPSSPSLTVEKLGLQFDDNIFSNGKRIQLAQNIDTTQPVPTDRDLQPPSTKPQEEIQPQPLPPSEELLKPTSPSNTPPDELPGTSEEKFIIGGFKFEDNTVFSDERLTAEIKKVINFENAPISFADLIKARSIITQLYVKEGYITSGAYIPLQRDFQEGDKITIEVLEGELEEIKIQGNRRLNPNYICSRVAIAAGNPLNQKRLVKGLQVLRLNPLFKSLSAELSATSTPGKSLLEITVVEAPTFDALVNLNNGRSPSVGSFRRSIQLSEANLLGLGDNISLDYTNTEGSNSINASYSIPISPYDTKVTLSYGTTSSNVIEAPFDTLGIESQSRYYELTLSHPIFKTSTSDFTLGLTTSRRESESSLKFENIGPYPLSPGTDEKGRTRISAIRFFQEWTQRSSRQVLAFRSQFIFGLDALDATINPKAPDSRFFAWRGQGQWVRVIGRDINSLILLRTDLQFADRPLLSSEQFGIGGLDSVRGYRQDALLTDNGFFTSAEVRLPILRIPEIKGVLQVTPFVEFGMGRNVDRPNPNPSNLLSTGLGLRWQMGNNLTARFDWGIPLIYAKDNNKTLQEQGLYFTVLWNPF
ncbi:peptide transporter [Scytonema hofmannii PCC 7110]|uniref:Peptide transporter n=1 Tax=Scytonema hofmannii PCC 7110 TaxID=128403 RepID=A0A139X839_9CYAN|nr:ShlB/FhaC/HecB family hemolysin secretion/activation protein [Scytonema hofmannii]KYC40825.1 peptide transporter [Scytonema hofmannii PCC 7110]